jgi:CheY-specific phosphatase CheX/anti-anti-sigma regulatory factor
MKPILKQKIAFFYPTGFIDGENAIDIVSPLDVDYLKSIKPEGIFISLKKVVFFNKRGISLIIESLNSVRDKNGAIIGFCDYDIKKYKMIVEMFKGDMFFSLFDSADIVSLYIGDDISTFKEKKILVYNDKHEQKNQLALELYERGFAPIIAKNRADFLAKRKDVDLFIENSYLGNLDKTPTVFIKDNVIVYTLKNFVDSDISKKFDLTYHNNTLRVGFKVFLFDATEVSSINVHGVNFIAKLSIAAAEYGATIAMCGLNARKITEKLTHDLEDAGVAIYPGLKDLFDDEELLSEAQNSTSVAKKGKGINKQLISYLPVVAEAALKTIENLSGQKIKRNALKLQELISSNTESAFGVSIGFYGDIEGVLILIMEQDIAKKTCKILLEDENKEDDLLDALGEFVHIIGGKISQMLHKKGVKIDITMPRTFGSLKEVMSAQTKTKGAQIDMELEGKPLILFLTK